MSDALEEVLLLLHPDVLGHMTEDMVREEAKKAWTLARDALCLQAIRQWQYTSQEGSHWFDYYEEEKRVAWDEMLASPLIRTRIVRQLQPRI